MLSNFPPKPCFLINYSFLLLSSWWPSIASPLSWSALSSPEQETPSKILPVLTLLHLRDHAPVWLILFFYSLTADSSSGGNSKQFLWPLIKTTSLPLPALSTLFLPMVWLWSCSYEDAGFFSRSFLQIMKIILNSGPIFKSALQSDFIWRSNKHTFFL